MGHGLLRARIFPLNPGEEKRIVVRFQSVAPREGDALRVDYFRGAAQGGAVRARRRHVVVHAELSSDAGARNAILADAFDRRRIHATDGAKPPCAAMRATSRCSFPCGATRRRRSACCRLLPGTKTAFTLVTVTPPLVVAQRNDGARHHARPRRLRFDAGPQDGTGARGGPTAARNAASRRSLSSHRFLERRPHLQRRFRLGDERQRPRRQPISRCAGSDWRNEHRRRAARSDAAVAGRWASAAHSLHHRRRTNRRRAKRRSTRGARQRS